MRDQGMPSHRALSQAIPSEGSERSWPDVNQPALYTIPEFIKAHRISRGKFYLMCKAGNGPAFVQIGTRRLISFEEAAAWRQKLTKRR